MSVTVVVPGICSMATALAVPRAPGCWHGGPGVLGTTDMLPKDRAKIANGIWVSLLSPLLGLAPLLWIAQRQQWWSSEPPPHPQEAVSLSPGITPQWPRRREHRFRSCLTLCPSQPDPTTLLGHSLRMCSSSQHLAQPRQAPRAPGTLPAAARSTSTGFRIGTLWDNVSLFKSPTHQ